MTTSPRSVLRPIEISPLGVEEDLPPERHDAERLARTEHTVEESLTEQPA